MSLAPDQLMHCGVCVTLGVFRLEPRPTPDTAPEGWVLVDITAMGICGTDSHIYQGKHPFLDYPRAIGHEPSGRVAAIEAGFAHVAHGGSYVLISVVKGEIRFSDAEFHKREMRLIGSRNALQPDFRPDFRAVMAALRSGQIDASKLASAVMPLMDLPGCFGALVQDRDRLIKVNVEIPQASGGQG